MEKDVTKLFASLAQHYTPQQAKEAIDRLLAPYGDTVRITFRDTDAEIIDSWKVDSQTVRHQVCQIIARTGLTERTYENLAAEWMVHTASYKAGVYTAHAKDVSLDYGQDPRIAVKAATRLFDILDIE